MATYASRNALKWTLLTINSINFIIALWIITHAVVHLIGIEEPPDDRRWLLNATLSSNETIDERANDDHRDNRTEIEAAKSPGDRFPCVGSSSVLLIFGVFILVIALIGCVATNMESPRLLDMYGYLAVLACFTKCLFVYATLIMHSTHFSRNRIALRPVVASVCIGIIELVLAMCSCHLAKVIKRGDAAEPRIRRYSQAFPKGSEVVGIVDR